MITEKRIKNASYREIVIALTLSLVALLTSSLVADGRYAIGHDGAGILQVARYIAEGKGAVGQVVSENYLPELKQSITKPKLYPYSMSMLIKMGVSSKWAGWSIAQGAFVFSVFIFYLLARIGMPTLPAIIATLMLCCLVSTLKWSIYIKEDTLYLMFSIAALYLLEKLRNGGKNSNVYLWVFLGVVSSLAVLTRYLGVAVLITVSIILIKDVFLKRQDLRRLMLFFAGVAVAGLIPFIQFVIIWMQGGRPSFFSAPEATWYLNMSGVVTSFQRDFTGHVLVWLRGRSFTDCMVLGISLVLLGFLLLAVSRRRLFASVALYIAIYLAILIIQLARNGFDPYEPRFSFPVEGLLVLIVVSLMWQFITHQSSIRRRNAILIVCLCLSCVYINGQWSLYRQFQQLNDGGSREICFSPMTIKWIKSNIPIGETVFGTQSAFQLRAETNDYYWLPIPPADEYSSSERYKLRWNEQNFLKIKAKIGARWIILLSGETGDPFKEKPGYGEFVTNLINGHETDRIRLRAEFKDGLVYEIL